MRKLVTVNQLVQKHLCFSKGGIRCYLFNRAINGLEQSGAILRLGRKILIDEEKFFDWVQTQSAQNKDIRVKA